MSGNKFTSVILATLLFMSVFAGAFAGSAAAYDHGAEYDAVLNDGGLYWQAQTLQFSDGTVSSGDKLTLRKVTDSGNTFVGEYAANSSGKVNINTDGFSGEYFLENSSGSELARFEVAEQSFSVDVDNSTVYNKEDIPQHTSDITFNSNRAGYDVVVESADLDMDELKTVFSDDNYVVRTDDNNEDYFVIQLSQNEETINGNFSSLSTGDYAMNFIVEDTGIEQSTTFDVADPGDKNAQFNQSLYDEDQGDVLEFDVTLDNTESAEVQFGNESHSGYEHNVSITDAQDDTLTLLFDTAEAGDGDATSPWSLHEDSDATITPGASETSLTNALDAYNYDLSVSVASLEKDVSTVNLRERNTESVTVHTMPKSANYELDDIQENATAVDEVAHGDKIVVAVEASGIYANLDNDTTGAELQNGSTFAMNNGFEVALINTDTGINANNESLDVSQAKDVVVNADENQFYVVFDSGDFTFSDKDEGHSVEAHFNMTQNNPYIDDEDEADAQSANASFEVVERTFEYDNLNDEDVLEVPTSSEAVVSGTTTAAPKTEVAINVRSNNGATNPFSISKDAVVQEDGTVEATYNLSQYDAGQEFTTVVRDIDLQRQDAILVEGGVSEYDVTFTVEGDEGDALANATVAVDGEEYTTDENGTASVSLADNTTYSVDVSAEGYESTSENVTVSADETDFTFTLETADEPTEYTPDVEVVDADGNAVANATVTVDGSEYTTGEDGTVPVTLVEGEYEFSVSADGYEDASVTQSITSNDTVGVELTASDMMDNGTDNDTDNGTDMSGNNSTETDSETGGQPGFGIAIALIALVGAALVAHRRA